MLTVAAAGCAGVVLSILQARILLYRYCCASDEKKTWRSRLSRNEANDDNDDDEIEFVDPVENRFFLFRLAALERIKSLDARLNAIEKDFSSAAVAKEQSQLDALRSARMPLLLAEIDEHITKLMIDIDAAPVCDTKPQLKQERRNLVLAAWELHGRLQTLLHPPQMSPPLPHEGN